MHFAIVRELLGLRLVTYGKIEDLVQSLGDIIFFDWIDAETGIRNGIADHTGIVEKVENGRVYTIEGNTSDTCARRDYDIMSLDILGYGTPMY